MLGEIGEDEIDRDRGDEVEVRLSELELEVVFGGEQRRAGELNILSANVRYGERRPAAQGR